VLVAEVRVPKRVTPLIADKEFQIVGLPRTAQRYLRHGPWSPAPKILAPHLRATTELASDFEDARAAADILTENAVRTSRK